MSLTLVDSPSLIRVKTIAGVAARAAPAPIPVVDVAGLISAINTANNETTNPGPDTVELASGGIYTLTTPDNFEYGPNALPQLC